MALRLTLHLVGLEKKKTSTLDQFFDSYLCSDVFSPTQPEAQIQVQNIQIRKKR